MGGGTPIREEAQTEAALQQSALIHKEKIGGLTYKKERKRQDHCGGE